MTEFRMLENITKCAINRQLKDGAINIVVLRHYYFNSAWLREWLKEHGCQFKRGTDAYAVLYVPVANRQVLIQKTNGIVYLQP